MKSISSIRIKSAAESTEAIFYTLKMLKETLDADTDLDPDRKIRSTLTGLISVADKANNELSEVLEKEESANEVCSRADNLFDNMFSVVMPKVAIEIPILPDFSGRLSVHLENGKLKCWYQYRPDEFTGTLEVFMELAKQAGWNITPHKENDDEA